MMADEGGGVEVMSPGQPVADENVNPDENPGASVNSTPEKRRSVADYDHIADLATPKRDYSASVEQALPPFKPTLMTPDSTREKVASSGYGTPNYLPKVVKEKPAPVEEKVDEKELTFQPNIAVTKTVREKVTSSAYGQQTPQKKDFSAKAEKPSFKPDMSRTATKRKSVTSTGYGKVLVNKKTVDPKKYAPEFKPKMDWGKNQGKLRNSTEPRFLAERQRPKTAPQQPATKAPLMFTLAADHSIPVTEPEVKGPGFVLDGSVLSSVPANLSKSDIDRLPPPVTPTAHGKKLKESTTSTGYGSTYKPPQGERVTVEPKPILKVGGTSTTWIEDPGALPVVHNKQTETAQPSYSPSAYKPATVKREIKQPEPSTSIYIPNKNDCIPDVESVVTPSSAHTKMAVASSGYGVVSPSAYDKRDPDRPRTAPSANGRPQSRKNDEQTTIL